MSWWAQLLSVLLSGATVLVILFRYVRDRLLAFQKMLTFRDEMKYAQLEQVITIQNQRIELLENEVRATLEEIKRYQQDPPGISC